MNAAWEQSARRAAMKVPALGAEIIALEARIREHQNSRREIMDLASYERRTLTRGEGAAFDSIGQNIETAEAKLRTIYRQVQAPPR